MYRERIAHLTTAMREHNLDAVVMTPGAGLRYFTGLSFHTGSRLIMTIFPVNGRQPCMLIPALEMTAAHAATRIKTDGEDSFLHFYPWSDDEGPDSALDQALAHAFRERDTSGLKIGAEYGVMRVMELHALQTRLPAMQTVDAAPLLASMRMVKNQTEIALMAEAVRIIETALRSVIKHIKPGVTERQLAAIWKNDIMQAGADGESFGCMVASGPNSANPHHHNSDRPFQAGDMIILDGGAIYQGYVSDITRTVALGTPDAVARRIYELVLAANTAARAMVRPGVTGEQVDRAARQIIADGGYGEFFLHRTGHGLGMECHELPNIVSGNTRPLEVGNTFTIEPGIYIAGVGGVRIEDDIVVTSEGSTSLTTFERELLVLPA